jgi:hypothetical protein
MRLFRVHCHLKLRENFGGKEGFILYDIWLWIYTEKNDEEHVRTLVKNFEPKALKTNILKIADGGELSGDTAGLIPDKALIMYMNIIEKGLNEDRKS